MDKLQTRSLLLEVTATDERTITFSFSSEYPAERGWGTEILSHAPGAMNLARAATLNFLWNHDLDVVLGKVTKIWQGSDRRGYCTTKWSNTPKAQEYRQEVEDGILDQISVRYTIDGTKELGDGGILVTKWTPLEISLTSVAVDPTVGVGRGGRWGSPSRLFCTSRFGWEASHPKADCGKLHAAKAFVTENATDSMSNHDITVGRGGRWGSPSMSNHDITVGRSVVAESIIEGKRRSTSAKTMTVDEKPPVDVESLRSEAITTERERIAAITALGRTHNLSELANKAVTEGRSLDQFKGAILEEIAKKPQNPVAAVNPVNPLGLSDKEQKNYSICRAITAYLDKDWSKAGFERECHDEIAKRSGVSPKGFLVPVRDLKVPASAQRAPFQVGVPGFGGNTVQTDLLSENFIDILRSRACVAKLGATVLSGLQGNVQIPRQNAASTAYWVAENGAITQSEATFDQIALSPKTIAARSQFSRLMLLQSSLDIEQFIRMDFAKIIALGIDDAALNGTGTGGQPRGIRNTPGIGSVALGANGGVPSWAAITQLETEVAQDNADIGEMAYLTNPKARGKLKNTLKSASAVSEFIWEDTAIMDGMGAMNGYKAGSANQVPSNLVKGTGTNLSAIFFGVWSQLIIGEWGILEILPNLFGAGYNSGAVDIRVMQTLDLNVRYPEAFALISDAITV